MEAFALPEGDPVHEVLVRGLGWQNEVQEIRATAAPAPNETDIQVRSSCRSGQEKTLELIALFVLLKTIQNGTGGVSTWKRGYHPILYTKAAPEKGTLWDKDLLWTRPRHGRANSTNNKCQLHHFSMDTGIDAHV